MHTGEDFKMKYDHDKSRTIVSGDPINHTLNVTISELTTKDTDRYYCEFIVENPSSEDEHIPGKTEFFLLVTAGDDCSCSSSSTLLYALSSAVVVLLLTIVFVGICLCKLRPSVKPNRQAPIYEDMAGFKDLKSSTKLAPNHLEDTVSVYNNTSVKKSCPENHYESPTGALCPRNETQT
ncbi:cd7 antigen-like [Scomber scombrus]